MTKFYTAVGIEQSFAIWVKQEGSFLFRAQGGEDIEIYVNKNQINSLFNQMKSELEQSSNAIKNNPKLGSPYHIKVTHNLTHDLLNNLDFNPDEIKIIHDYMIKLEQPYSWYGILIEDVKTWIESSIDCFINNETNSGDESELDEDGKNKLRVLRKFYALCPDNLYISNNDPDFWIYG